MDMETAVIQRFLMDEKKYVLRFHISPLDAASSYIDTDDVEPQMATYNRCLPDFKCHTCVSQFDFALIPWMLCLLMSTTNNEMLGSH